MKNLIIALTIIFSSISTSNDLSFTIEHNSGMSVLKENTSGEFIVLKTFNLTIAKLIKIETEENFKLIYYYAGEAGTSKLIGHEMVAIYDTKTKLFLDQTYTTRLIGLNEQAQPILKIENGKVNYHLPLD